MNVDNNKSPAVFGAIDITVLTLYFVAVIATSVFAMCRFQRNTTEGYFLAGRFMTFLPIGASLFVSNIGSEHFIGLAGSGAAGGIGVGAFEIHALVIYQVLGWFFLPVYLASGVVTLPEYLQKRFGGRRVNIYISTLSLLMNVLAKISVNLYSGSIFIHTALHWDLYASILLIIGLTALFTLSGGLAAVIYTDTIQAVLILAGGLTLMTFSFNEVGGIAGLYSKYMLAAPNSTLYSENYTTCGLPRSDALQMLRHPINSDVPWPGFIFGVGVVCIWYFCTDQVIVQRALAAKNLAHGQGGTLLGGYLKIIPLFMIVMPGMVSRVLYPNEIGCALPEECERICGNKAGCSNMAYPKLIMELMPDGLRGLMVAVMLAALITGLTSIYNSAASLFTVDIYPLFRSKATNRELMIVGRVFVVVMTVVSILWVPIIKSVQGGQLFMYIQTVQAYLSPPIAAVFLMAALWPRANEQGAFWSLMAGLVSGAIRLALDFTYGEPQCGMPDMRPAILRHVHYMYFALILFVQTVLVIVVISLLTQPLPQWRIIRTVFGRRFDTSLRQDDFTPDALLEEEALPMTEDVEIEPTKGRTGLGYWLRHAFAWWCGLNDLGDANGKNANRPKTEEEAQAEVDKLVGLLKQGKRLKLFLTINLVLIIIVTIVIYVLFSLPPSLFGF